MTRAAAPEFGVYVHIPFCTVRCDYCAFATTTDQFELVDAYVDACVADLDRHAATGTVPAVTSLFFGGGTPSLLAPHHIERIIDAVPLAGGAEVTLESNPDSIDAARLSAYRAAGVNRISVGVQSLDPAVLASLGRTHDPDNVARAVDAIGAAGFPTWNLDLIYGAAGETDAQWDATVAGVVAFGPPHVSAYALTIEAGTPLARAIAAGATAAPDDDDQAGKYERADAAFAAAGLDWYEVSNWARPGEECRHNSLYWSGGEYLGIGAAAHGHTGGRRWWNVSTPARYVERMTERRGAEAGAEQLTLTLVAEERVALALRTRAGVRPPRGTEAIVADLVAGGFVERVDDRVVLTRSGRLVATEVTARLLPDDVRAGQATLGVGTR